uniref:Putative secreted protein n=1 Tax=Rhipicephalus microplus TaxID=6941 RepID=A0A6G5A3W0_RHIMP
MMVRKGTSALCVLALKKAVRESFLLLLICLAKDWHPISSHKETTFLLTLDSLTFTGLKFLLMASLAFFFIKSSWIRPQTHLPYLKASDRVHCLKYVTTRCNTHICRPESAFGQPCVDCQRLPAGSVHIVLVALPC